MPAIEAKRSRQPLLMDSHPLKWCGFLNTLDLAEDRRNSPGVTECGVIDISDNLKNKWNIPELVESRKSFEIFKADIAEGFEEARTLRYDYDPLIPLERIDSTTPGCEMMKVRSAWPAGIAEWRYVDVSWAWANYVNPELQLKANDFAQYVGTEAFAKRYIEDDFEGNIMRAQELIFRGDQLLDMYLKSFIIMRRINRDRFTKVIAPHYLHLLEHFFIEPHTKSVSTNVLAA